MIQEIDLILEKQDVLQSAMSDWKAKWVPAILQYAHECTGKVATIFLQAEKAYEGKLIIWFLYFCLLLLY